MTDARTLHRRWMKEPAYRVAHAAMAPEFELASELIAARRRAGLPRATLAKCMRTTQSTVARGETPPDRRRKGRTG